MPTRVSFQMGRISSMSCGDAELKRTTWPRVMPFFRVAGIQ
jgi:hypothetical protein